MRYEAIDTGLATVADHALELGASLHMPWIEPLIESRLTARNLSVTVYDFD